MDQLPITSAYRTAAILAAFSRASDEVAGAVPPLAPIPQAPSGTLLQMLGDVVRRRFRRTGVSATTPWMASGPDLTAATRTGPASRLTGLPDTHEAVPALASHFDLCRPAGPEARSHEAA